MEYAASLQADAQRANERRLLVLTGSHEECLELAGELFSVTATDPDEAVAIDADGLPCEAISHHDAAQLMGTTQQLLVYDCHDRCEPNTLGRAVGAVDGGGLFVLLVPPLSEWPDRDDQFAASLAVEPFEESAVGGNFRQRLVNTLRAGPGVAIVDANADRLVMDGREDPPPRLPRDEPAVSAGSFPAQAYDACLTPDQARALAAFETLTADEQAVVLEADRGRGKSSAAGLGAASLAYAGDDVLVTAPNYRNAEMVFERASELFSELDGVESTRTEGLIETGNGTIRFAEPTEATSLPGEPDQIIVDEAAAIPVDLLDALLAVGSVAFVTTIHGYEGAGRGFSVRFRKRLTESELSVTECQLTEPIRHGSGDPVEIWSFRALGLDATPVPDQVLRDADSQVSPTAVSYRRLSTAELLADEHLLREVFGLLVEAHYRTEPNDFARLLDAPNLSVHALLADGHAVSVALLAREGGLSPETREQLSGGERIRGNLIPDLLTSQLCDPDAGRPVGERVVRVATHSAVRSRGLGSRLLAELETEARGQNRDWIGVGYGATPQLVEFWRTNGYCAVHLSTTRSERSGEHSAIMLKPLSPEGESLTSRHTEWFARRFPSTLTNALSSLDADVVRAVCRTIERPPPLSLSAIERRTLEGIPAGTAIYDTAPRPVRMLSVRYLIAGDDRLSPREERLLVRKCLQARPWDLVAEELGYSSTTTCKRALGDAVGKLLDWYGSEGDR